MFKKISIFMLFYMLHFSCIDFYFKINNASAADVGILMDNKDKKKNNKQKKNILDMSKNSKTLIIAELDGSTTTLSCPNGVDKSHLKCRK